jgi:DNA-binding GntR family transcriptional regulator
MISLPQVLTAWRFTPFSVSVEIFGSGVSILPLPNFGKGAMPELSFNAPKPKAGGAEARSLDEKFEPIEASTLNQDVYRALCKALRDGRLLPGQSIGIRYLASAMNTSPMPVREALRRLEAQGVLEILPGRILRVPGLDARTVEEVYGIRIALETLAVRAAARLRDDSEVASLKMLCERMQSAFDAGNHRAFMESNYDFHFGIYRAARMPQLMRIIEPLWLRISPFLWSLVEENHLRFAMDQHWRAFEAFAQGDADTLSDAIRVDIAQAQKRLLEWLQTGA